MGYEFGDDRSGGTVQKKTRAVRPWLLVVLASLILILAAVGVVLFVQGVGQRIVAQHERAAVGRQQRVQPVAAVALAPLPAKSPVVERPGADSYGYPLAYVDRTAVRGLLGHGKYQELSDYFRDFETAAEADFHAEYFLSDSTEAFESAERSIEPSLDAWVKATPSAFAPYLARGAHRFAVGFALRGSAFRSETDADNFKAMDAEFALAFADLEQALRLNPRLIPARRDEIRIAFVGSQHRAEVPAMAARAFEICPGCFQVRVTLQLALQPRWGGTYAQMAAAARSANVAINPRFKQLPGYALIDQAATAKEKKDFVTARAIADRAVALGDNADFLLELARICDQQDDETGALRAASRALALRPMRADLLLFRANLYTDPATRDVDAAYRDLITGLRLEPADASAQHVLARVVNELTFDGWDAHKRGDENNALRLLDEASELAPSRDLEARRTTVLTSGFQGTAQELAALESAAKAAPHDFYSHERFDYALSLSRDWNRIGAMWGVYIAQNPEDGRAYYERAGTFANQQQMPAALADATRGCELGVSASCAFALQMSGRAK